MSKNSNTGYILESLYPNLYRWKSSISSVPELVARGITELELKHNYIKVTVNPKAKCVISGKRLWLKPSLKVYGQGVINSESVQYVSDSNVILLDLQYGIMSADKKVTR